MITRQEPDGSLSLIETIVEVTSGFVEPDRILNQALDKLISGLAVDSGLIQLFDPEKGELILTAHHGLTLEMVAQVTSLKPEQSPAGKIALSGKPVTSADISADPDYSLSTLTAAGIRSFIAVPLKSGDKILGVVSLFSQETNKFSDYELRLLSTVASYLANSVDRAFLSHQAEEKERQLEAIRHLVASITSTTTISQMYDSFKGELKKAVPADWVEVALIEGDKLRFIVLAPEQLAVESMELEQLAGIIPLAGTAVEWIIQNQKPFVEGDLVQERHFWTSEYHYEWGLRSMAYVPLSAAGETLGALVVGSNSPKAFKRKELTTIEHFARQLAMPLYSARLYQENIENAQLLSTANELAKIINSSADIDEVYQDFATKLKELVAFDRLSIDIIDGDSVRFMAVYSTVDTELTAGSTYPLADSALGWLKEYKITNVEKDFTRERQFPIDDILLKNGLKSAIRVPLLARGEVFGSLDLSNTKPNAYSRKEQIILEHLASLISGAIQSANLYTLEKSQRQQLEEQEKQRQQFLSALSHELQTPLTALIASAGLLAEELRKKPESPQNRLAQNIIHSASSLQNRLAELLDLARAQVSGFEIKRKSIDVPALTQEVVASFLPLIRDKGLSLSLELPPSLIVNADEQRLEQILLNLLSNAIKFTPVAGQIILRAREEKENLIVEIQDTGPGIPKEEQIKLFRPYYQVMADRHRVPGLGLGLAITKQLVELHGGRIWVDSEPGRGSTFAFSLPIE